MSDPRVAEPAPDRLIAGRGTDETAWGATGFLDRLDEVDVVAWATRYRRIWVLAPHPDDEVLALGGVLGTLAQARADVCVVSVTDGEASHRGSSTWTPEKLMHDRPIELRRALDLLGSDADVVRLGLPDSDVDAQRATLADALAGRVDARDLILTTCGFDGHPDHEASAAVAQAVGRQTGAAVFEYPVWMWHWATPTTATIPWHRARRITTTVALRERKRAALAAFVSQIEPDGASEAVLPPHVLPRFLRGFEIVFVP